MSLSEEQKRQLVQDFADLASATGRLAMIDFSDGSASNLLSNTIVKGVDNLAATNFTMEELSTAAQNLVGLIFEISSELPNNSRTASSMLITKSWKKRCPGCPPWC